MALLVSNQAALACDMGLDPCALVIVPNPTAVGVPGSSLATIADMLPANIATFGMCTSPANPSVQAATATASGVLTPAPCVPAIVAPWDPPSASATIAGVPAFTQEATCQCTWSGTITVTEPGQTVTTSL
jgi:hypothetical protein